MTQKFIQLRERTIRCLEIYEVSGKDWLDACTKEKEGVLLDEILISDLTKDASGLIGRKSELFQESMFAQMRRVAGEEIATAYLKPKEEEEEEIRLEKAS